MQVPFVAVERQLIQTILVSIMLPSYYFIIITKSSTFLGCML